jgi:hypothetical protein
MRDGIVPPAEVGKMEFPVAACFSRLTDLTTAPDKRWVNGEKAGVI